MSMNLNMYFKDSKGRSVHKVDLVQTPTDDSYKMIEAEDVKEAYLAWYAERAEKYGWDKVEPRNVVNVADPDLLDTYEMELAFGEEAIAGDFQYVDLPPVGGHAAEERKRLENEIKEWGEDYELIFEVW